MYPPGGRNLRGREYVSAGVSYQNKQSTTVQEFLVAVPQPHGSTSKAEMKCRDTLE